MARFWTCHWQHRYWRPDINREGEPIRACGSNSFRKRGVAKGDSVYVVSMSAGQLYLGGRMTVIKFMTRSGAARLLGSDDLYDADEWIVDPQPGGTPLNLQRRLAPGLARELRFEMAEGPKPPCFVSDTELDRQATRGIRELTAQSAALLDRVIEETDRLPASGRPLNMTDNFLRRSSTAVLDVFRLPDEVHVEPGYAEGSVQRVEVNRYERDARARAVCIAAHGVACCVCGFRFGEVYGPEAEGYIHVHHIRPLSEAGGERVVDPVRDLRPVCPNCHAVLHLGGRCRSIDEVRGLLRRQSQAPPSAPH